MMVGRAWSSSIKGLCVTVLASCFVLANALSATATARDLHFAGGWYCPYSYCGGNSPVVDGAVFVGTADDQCGPWGCGTNSPVVDGTTSLVSAGSVDDHATEGDNRWDSPFDPGSGAAPQQPRFGEGTPNCDEWYCGSNSPTVDGAAVGLHIPTGVR